MYVQVTGAVHFMLLLLVDMTALLLKNGSCVNLSKGNIAGIHYAAIQNGHANVVQLLLNNVFEVNSGGNDRGSPLFVAQLNDHESTVQLLLHNGAESDVTTDDGISPLKIACGNDILLRENDPKTNLNLHAEEYLSLLAQPIRYTFVLFNQTKTYAL